MGLARRRSQRLNASHDSQSLIVGVEKRSRPGELPGAALEAKIAFRGYGMLSTLLVEHDGTSINCR